MAVMPNTLWIFDNEVKMMGGGMRRSGFSSGMNANIGGMNVGGIMGVAAAIGEAKFAYDQAKSGNLQKQQGQNKPAHMYEGTAEVQGAGLVLKGKSVQDNTDVTFQIPFANIRNASIGFDNNYTPNLIRGGPAMGQGVQMGNMGMGPGMGMNRGAMGAPRGIQPLKIEYQDQSGKRMVYVFVNYGTATGMPMTSNNEVLTILKGSGVKSGFHLF